MKCENCKYYNDNYPIKIMMNKKITYWEQGVYCSNIKEADMTPEDLKTKCKLRDD